MSEIPVPQETIQLHQINPELQDNTPESILQLQNAREIMTQRLAASELRATFNSMKHPESEYFALKSVSNSLPVYEGQVTARSLLSLQAVGVDTDAIIPEFQSNQTGTRVVAQQELGDSKLSVGIEGQGMFYKLDAEDTNDQPKNIEDQIVALMHNRLLASPAHQALLEVAESIDSQETLPERLQTKPFDYRTDPLGTVSFLSEVGLVSDSYSTFRELSAGGGVDDLIDATLANVSKYSTVVSTDENSSTYTWLSHNKTVRKQLILDSHDNTAVFSAEQQPLGAYLEKANQSEARSLPFIETKCASELSSFLDEAGLMFHPDLQLEMINIGDANRYGSIYTQITREIAKWVDSPNRTHLSNLFVPTNPAYSATVIAQGDTRPEMVLSSFERMTEDRSEDIEAQVRASYQSAVHHAESGAANAVFSMVDDVLARMELPDESIHSDLPITNESIHITNGACFDVAAYYVGAADQAGWRQPDALRYVETNGVSMLEKKHGSHTFLTTEPITFNGVRLPKGALFSKSEDEGWVFQRLTPFAFDEAEDQLVFGSEMSKLFKNEEDTVKRIGDATMQSLINAASKR